jgi:hypothetical protein
VISNRLPRDRYEYISIASSTCLDSTLVSFPFADIRSFGCSRVVLPNSFRAVFTDRESSDRVLEVAFRTPRRPFYRCDNRNDWNSQDTDCITDPTFFRAHYLHQRLQGSYHGCWPVSAPSTAKYRSDLGLLPLRTFKPQREGDRGPLDYYPT